MASQIGKIRLHDHFEHIQQRKDAENIFPLQKIVLFDEVKESKGNIGVEPYPSFLALSVACDVNELKRAAEIVKPNDLINLQFTSGRAS
jgi:hypothetical protein